MKLDLNTWLRADDLSKVGDTVVLFTDEGSVVEGVQDGQPKLSFEIGVRLPNGEERRWTMNKTSQRAVAQALGSTDTKDWVGKGALVFAADQNIEGKLKKVLYARSSKSA